VFVDRGKGEIDGDGRGALLGKLGVVGVNARVGTGRGRGRPLTSTGGAAMGTGLATPRGRLAWDIITTVPVTCATKKWSFQTKNKHILKRKLDLSHGGGLRQVIEALPPIEADVDNGPCTIALPTPAEYLCRKGEDMPS
jgi:hypothetical protein